MLRWLFAIVSLDLFLGGGGRLLEIGPLSLRMLLFALAMVVTVLVYAGRPGDALSFDPQERLGIGLVVAFILTHVGAALVGWLSENALADIMTDVKPLTFVLIAPFFALCVKRCDDVALAARLLRVSGVLLAVAYLIAWTALTAGIFDFDVIYPLLNDTGEFYFRGSSFFFYKGFLYLGVGIVFMLAAPGRATPLLVAIVALALILTLTRGFVLSTSVAVVLLLAMRNRRVLLLLLPPMIIGAIGVFAWLPTLDPYYMGQRPLSTAIRENDWNFFVDHVDIGTLLVGEGFGTWFNERLIFENSYLWILWKAGLPALAFWLAPLVIATRWFVVALRVPERETLAMHWWCSVLLVYAQTATNPFLTNPIGSSIVLLALMALRTLALPVSSVPASAPAPVLDPEGGQVGSPPEPPPRVDDRPVSVAMATYNGRRWIEAQVDSILTSLRPDDELVVVDDGSIDGTWEWLSAHPDRRIRTLRNESNLGVRRTFERAFEATRHGIVFLSDQDDEWTSGKRDAIVEAFAADPRCVVVVSDAAVVDGDGVLLQRSFMAMRGGFRGSLTATLVRSRYLGCAMAVRREVLDAALPIPPDAPMHDMWLGAIGTRLGTVRYVDAPLIRYRRHGGNLSPASVQFGRRALRWRIGLAWALVRRWVALRGWPRAGGPWKN
jgi:hypothetical protein